MHLSCRQTQPQRIAQSIDYDMDFGAEPAPTTSQCLCCLSAAFFEHPLRMDALARWYYPASHFPYLAYWQRRLASVPTPLPHTTVQNVYTHYSTHRTRSATSATVRHSGLSTARPQQTADSPLLVQHTPVGRPVKSRVVSSIVRLKVGELSSIQFTSNVNRT